MEACKYVFYVACVYVSVFAENHDHKILEVPQKESLLTSGSLETVFNYGVIPVGYPEVLKVKESKAARYIQHSLEGVNQWYLLGENLNLQIVGTGDNFIALGSSDSDNFTTIKCEGLIKSAAIIQQPESSSSVRGSILVVVEGDEGSRIASYGLKDLSLVENWRESISNSGEFIAAWQDFILMGYSTVLELYHKQSGLILLAVEQTQVPISDLALFQDGPQWFAAVALSSDEEIVVYQLNRIDQKPIARHSSIHCPGIVSFTAFQYGMSNYLAVAGSNAGIWRVVSNGDIISVLSNGGRVEAWLAVPLDTYRQDKLLLAQTGNTTTIYTAIGFSEFCSVGNLSSWCGSDNYDCDILTNSMNLKKAAVELDTILLPNEEDLLLLTLQPYLDETPNKMELLLQELEQLKTTLTEYLEDLDTEVVNLITQEAPVINPNVANYVEGNWTVDTLTMGEGDFQSVTTKDEFEVVRWSFAGRNDWSEEDMEVDLKQLREHINDFRRDIEGLREQIQNETVNFDPEDNQIQVTIPPSLDGVLEVEGQVFVENLKVDYLNDESADAWIQDCYRLDQPQVISGTKTIPQLKVDSLRFKHIGGILASDLVIVGPDLSINGDLIFESDVTIVNDVIIPSHGTVNGLNLSEDLLQPDETMPDNVTFDSVIVKGPAEIGEFVWPSERESIILPARFSLKDMDPASLDRVYVDHIVVSNQLNVRYINDLDIKELLHDRQEDNTPEKNISVSSLSIQYLNGNKFPEDFVVMSAIDSQVLSGSKSFSSLQVSDLFTGTEVFLSLLSKDHAMARSFMDSDEIEEIDDVDGQLVYVFDELEVAGPGKIHSINGVPWLDYNLSLGDEAEEPVEGQSERKRLCRSKSALGNDIEDEDLNLFALKAEIIEIRGSLSIQSAIVSGFPISKYTRYLSKSNKQLVPSSFFNPKRISVYNLTTAQPLSVPSTFNSMSPSITSVKVLDISGQLDAMLMTFNHPVHVDHLEVAGPVAEIDLETFVNDTVSTMEDNVYLRGKKSFTHSVIVQDVNVHTMNGRRPASLASRRGDLSFSGPISLKGRVHVQGDLNILGDINGANLTELALSVSPAFGAFLVPGDLDLAAGTSIEKLKVDGLIQGVNLVEFLDNAVFRDLDFELESSHIKFLNNVTILGDLTVRTTLNALNVSALLEDVVSVNRPATLDHLILNSSIIQHLNVTQGLNARLIDGCNVQKWREEAILLNEFVYGRVNFSNLEVHGDIKVSALNGHSIDSLIPLRSNQIIPGTMLIRSLTTDNHVQVHHLVNGHYLPELHKDSLLNGGQQVVTGVKTFSSDVKVKGSINVTAVSGRNLSTFVTLDTAQLVTVSLNFTDDVKFHDDVHVTGLLSGVDVRKWNARALLPARNTTVKGSWTVLGNVSVRADIDGSGLLLNSNFINASEELDRKLKIKGEVQTHMQEFYQDQCMRVQAAAATTKDQLRVLDMFEDIQGIQFHTAISSVISYKVKGEAYLLITFSGRCSAFLYRWGRKEEKFSRISRVKIGSVDAWTTLPVSQDVFLVVSGSKACERKTSSAHIWKVTDTNFAPVASLDPFVDVIVDNFTSNVFYTVALNGSIYKWSLNNELLEKNSLLVQLPVGTYKFAPFSLGLGLAVWDGDRLIVIGSNSSLFTSSRIAAASFASAADGLVATSDGASRVELYKGAPNGDLIDSLLHSVATDLLWVDLKTPGELYLVFASDHHKIQVYQYKGVSGLVKRANLPYPSSSLTLLELPHAELAATPHILVVNNLNFHLLQARFNGDPPLDLNLTCQEP